MKKLLLLTSLLTIGSISAWAETATIPFKESCYIDASNASTNYNGTSCEQLCVRGTYFRDSSASGAYGTVRFNTSNYSMMPFYKFDLSDFSVEGTITKVTFTFQILGSSDSKYCQDVCAVGYNEEWEASEMTGEYLDDHNTGGTPASTYLTGTVSGLGSFQPLNTTTTISVEGNAYDPTVDYDYDATDYVLSAIEAGKSYVSLAIVENLGRLVYLPVETTLTVEYTTATVADVAISYQLEDGTVVKTANSTATNTVGSTATLSDDDIADFTLDSSKYIYVSNNASSVTVAESETEVVVIVREAETYSYTVNMVDSDGNVLKTVETGSDYEGASVTVYYPLYVNVDGTLYSSTKQSTNPWYGKSITLTADGQEENITMTATSVTNVVYFSEGEDIEGLTSTTAGNADIRCSMGAGGYNAGTENVEVTTLQPGTYQMHAYAWGSTTYYMTCGETTLTFSTGTFTSSEEFTLEEATAVYIPTCGSSQKSIDYVYITGTVAEVDEPEVDEPEDEGEGDEEEEEPEPEETAEEINERVYQEVTAEISTIQEEFDAVILTFEVDYPDVAYLFEERIEAIQAKIDALNERLYYLYLACALTDTSDVDLTEVKAAVNELSEAFATAVASLKAQSGDAVIYDLSGRKVTSAKAGIYIINGVKVVIK